MAGSIPLPSIPLPRGWSHRVRSAVVHAISLAQFSLGSASGLSADQAAGRHHREIHRLRHELCLLREEMRLKDARMGRIPGQRRPQYQPIERLAILELRAARGWSLSQTAMRLHITPATVASWMGRLEEEGPEALVQLRTRMNRFPEFVGYLVRRLKMLCPVMGKKKIAQVLCRAGLHLGPTTVRRMLTEHKPWRPAQAAMVRGRSVLSKRPNNIWHVDLTTVPTALGFWVSWVPWAVPQSWPFCWWLSVAIDHYSRRILGFALFEKEPTSLQVRTFLGRVMRESTTRPRHFITDQGKQFVDRAFRRWWQIRGICQRFGTVGKYGSISVIERAIRTMKREGTRMLLVPFSRPKLQREISIFVEWYNEYRPHGSLGAKTPDEVYRDIPPACEAPRFEPRRSWPRGSPCAHPPAPVRGRRGVVLELNVSCLAGRRHLPIVQLKRVA